MAVPPDAAPWLTIVTVVRNDVAGLARTVASLAQADLSGVQFLVIDGSDDRSEVQSVLAGSEIESQEVVWEPPRGIYPAMNAGLARAHGTFLYFLNAGDTLHSPAALTEVAQGLADAGDAIWIVGRVCFVDADGSCATPPLLEYARERHHLFARGEFPAHQGTLGRTAEIARLGGFDESYTIAADYHLALRLSQIAEPLLLDVVLADFPTGGSSSVRWRQSVREFHRARREVLRPAGIAALVEATRTWLQFTELALFHSLVAPTRTALRSRSASP
jgi:glycosyltransferase involved in cell wall biosynthesis